MDPGSETVRAMSPITSTDIYSRKKKRCVCQTRRKVRELIRTKMDSDRRSKASKALSRKLLSHPLPLRKLQA